MHSEINEMISFFDSVAQLVEQLTLNQWVEGSSPSGVTEKMANKQLHSLLAVFYISQRNYIEKPRLLNFRAWLFYFHAQHGAKGKVACFALKIKLKLAIAER